MQTRLSSVLNVAFSKTSCPAVCSYLPPCSHGQMNLSAAFLKPLLALFVVCHVAALRSGQSLTLVLIHNSPASPLPAFRPDEPHFFLVDKSSEHAPLFVDPFLGQDHAINHFSLPLSFLGVRCICPVCTGFFAFHYICPHWYPALVIFFTFFEDALRVARDVFCLYTRFPERYFCVLRASGISNPAPAGSLPVSVLHCLCSGHSQPHGCSS